MGERLLAAIEYFRLNIEYFLSGEETYDNMRSLLGNERVGRWKPFRSILDSGALIVGGSDAPVTKMSPLKGIQKLQTTNNRHHD